MGGSFSSPRAEKSQTTDSESDAASSSGHNSSGRSLRSWRFRNPPETVKTTESDKAPTPHAAEADMSTPDSSAGDGQVMMTQGQKALRKADSLAQKSLDSVGLAELIRQQGESGAGGKPRPPSIGATGGPGNPFGSSSDASNRCFSTADGPNPDERPPFAKFESRQTKESWTVMDTDLKEVGAIDVMRSDGYDMAICGMSVNKTNKTLAVANKSGEAHVFSIETGKVKNEIGRPVRLPLTSISHNCDGTLIATGASDKALRLYDAPSGRVIGSSSAHQSFVTCLAFSNRDPLLLASGGGDKPLVRVWKVSERNPTTGGAELLEQCVLVGHWAFLTSVAFSPDDNFLASSSMDWTIRVWDLENGEPMVNMSFSASLVQDRTRMQVKHLRHINHRQMEAELVSDGSDVRFAWERPGFKEPLRLCRVPDTDGWGRQVEARFQYVEVTKGEVIYTSSGWLRTLKGHCGPVNHVAWSPDGRHLVSAGDDGTVRMWDAQCELNEELVLDSRFLEGTEGHHILAIEDEMMPGEEECSMCIEADQVVKFKIKFSEEGGFYKHHAGILGSGFKRTRRPNCQFVDRFRNPIYQIIREEDGAMIFDTNLSKVTFRGHEGPVACAKFWMAKVLSVSDDGTLRLWNPVDQACLFVVAASVRYPLCDLTVCEDEPEAVILADRKGGVSIILAENFAI